MAGVSAANELTSREQFVNSKQQAYTVCKARRSVDVFGRVSILHLSRMENFRVIMITSESAWLIIVCGMLFLLKGIEVAGGFREILARKGSIYIGKGLGKNQ